MRLLVVTQKVDRSDPILGFFHRWLAGLAERCEILTVIGQAAGPRELPANVTTLSLRKEDGVPTWRQVARFWRLILTHAGEYDAVLVHMTPVWVILGAPLWLLLRKPVFLWYEVRRGGRILRWAVRFSKAVFSATEDGLPFKTPKNLVVGHGIDTSAFRPGEEPRDPDLLLTVGRATPIKRYEVIIAAAAAQPGKRLLIAGGPVLPSDHAYVERVRRAADAAGFGGRLEMRFHTEAEVIDALQRCAVFLHACGGGLDKVLLEAMACGCLVLSCAEAAPRVLPPDCVCAAEDMPRRLTELLALAEDRAAALRSALRQTVETHHSLPRLLDLLVAEMTARGGFSPAARVR